MAIPNPQYEVEIRCHFDNQSDAYEAIPFLRSCLELERTGVDTYYGLELFKAGRVLRISNVFLGQETSHYLAWKGPDIGQFANIRQELGEDITTGIADSAIMNRLGGKGRLGTHSEVIQEIERLGHRPFMSNEGRNLKGRCQPLGIDVKLMIWSKLKWPLIVEFEKIAHTEAEARQFEKDLYELSRQLRLESCLVKQEPPTQLYAAVFGREGLIQSTNVWNGIYKQRGRLVIEPHEDMPGIAQLLKHRGASTVLDLGSGTGRHVTYLARNGFSVFGLDNSPAGIELTRRWLADEGLTADLQLQTMAEKLPYEDAFFDAIISVQVIHHADSATIKKIVQELTRVLKGGGFLFLTVPKLKNQGEHFEQLEPNTAIPLDGPERGLPHHYFTPEELREVFGGFDIADVHLDTVNHYCLSAFKR